MELYLAITGTFIGLMTFFWLITSRIITKQAENMIKNHKEDPTAHYIYVENTKLELSYDKLLSKLNEVTKELIDLREEFHIFKEKLTTKFDL